MKHFFRITLLIALMKNILVLIFSSYLCFVFIGAITVADFMGISMLIFGIIFFVSSFISIVFLILFFNLKKTGLLICYAIFSIPQLIIVFYSFQNSIIIIMLYFLYSLVFYFVGFKSLFRKKN